MSAQFSIFFLFLFSLFFFFFGFVFLTRMAAQSGGKVTGLEARSPGFGFG